MTEVGTALSQRVAAFIEEQLVRQIKILEGRVPSDAEVARYGACAIFPDGRREWGWKGQVLLVQEAPALDGFCGKWFFVTIREG